MGAVRRTTYDLLTPIVNSIYKWINGDSITNHGNGTYTLYTCDTLWLTVKRKFTINSVSYTVEDLSPNEWVKLKGVSQPPLKFEIYSPQFVHGTIIAQSTEYDNRSHLSWNKLPMIYLQEITREDFNNDVSESGDRDSDCTIYFMTEANIKDWKIVDHDKYAVMPMRNLLFGFIEALNEATNVDADELKKYSVYNRQDWGEFLFPNGQIKKYFKDDLSGSELRITIPFLKC